MTIVELTQKPLQSTSLGVHRCKRAHFIDDNMLLSAYFLKFYRGKKKKRSFLVSQMYDIPNLRMLDTSPLDLNIHCIKLLKKVFWPYTERQNSILK